MLHIAFQNNVLLPEQEIPVNIMKENAYHIDLPAGRYQVRVSAGDLQDEGDVNVHCILNGMRQIPIWVNDRSINSRVYDAEVKDAGLTLEFFGKYVCLQAILIEKALEDVVENLAVESGKGQDGFYAALRWDIPRGQREELFFHIYKWDVKACTDPERIICHGREYIDKEVSCCRIYRYAVCAANEAGFEGKQCPAKEILVRESAAAPVVLTKFSVEAVTDASVTLTWRNEAGVNEYVLYKKPLWGNPKEIGRVSGLVRSVCLSFEDSDVVTDRPYEYQLEAECDGGISNRLSVTSPVKARERLRQMEALDRGLVAVMTEGGVYLSWRLLAYEYAEGAAFRIYKNHRLLVERTGEQPTNYLDTEGAAEDLYYVTKVYPDGSEEKEPRPEKSGVDRTEKNRGVKPLTAPYLELKLDKPAPYTAPDGNTYEYTANDASAADLDGDGEYEIILKWDCNGKDNSHKGYSGLCLIDAYKLDGTKLWRINMGANIRCGAHYTQFLAYDFDGDGYAEMICKTADGTVDGTGNVIGDGSKDYRNRDGFILEGPEYLSVFDGRTGKVLDTIPYDPPRGNVSDYGDSWGNRVDRFLACAAYLDGVHPSAVMCRGYYDHGRPTNLVAYDLTKDKKLKKRWKFLARWDRNIEYTNQGFHNLAVADVDGDGCDEIVYGACVIDHDGTGLYSTGLGHGDAMHVGRFTADSKGYDYFGIHEDADCPYGIEARDAGTGKVSFGQFTGQDTTRGLTAKIDPRYPGNQMWAMCGDGLYNYQDGKKIADKFPKSINFAIWWDGDLLRELCDHEWFGYETGKSLPRIYKWNWETEEMDTLLAPEECAANNGSKGNPCLQADLFGDWREEVVWRTKDSTALHIYTTTDMTTHRLYTLMHDPVYRLGVAWQNIAYNQPPQTGFYMGPDMKNPPIPKIKLK